MSEPRVVHLVESLHRAAIENWLLRMLRHARRSGLNPDWTFYCILQSEGSLEAEARALGATVIRSPVPIGDKLAFVRALRAVLWRGRFDVLHCHHDLVSSVYLAASIGLPIRTRIVHVHNADEAVLTPSRFKQRLFRPVLRRTALLLSDRIVGISQHTLDTLLAGRPRRAGRDVVHYYGVDPEPFVVPGGARERLRIKLGLPERARILLFAGRMVPEKNPIFAVEVLAAMRQRDHTVIGLFAGSGSLDAQVRRRAAELGLTPYCRHLGWRDDLPDVMACSDCFILPHPEHPMEGFGVAVVEAQLAGLPLLLSTGIADDPLLPTAHFRRLSLEDGAPAWAMAALDLMHGPALSRSAAFAALKSSPMNLDRALEDLRALHA